MGGRPRWQSVTSRRLSGKDIVCRAHPRRHVAGAGPLSGEGRTMRDPELVARAQRAAARLESAWEQWRALHGLAVAPGQPVVSYVGYSLKEPWGEPRVVIGIDADEAEYLAEFLDRDECAQRGQAPHPVGTAAAGPASAGPASAGPTSAGAASIGPASASQAGRAAAGWPRGLPRFGTAERAGSSRPWPPAAGPGPRYGRRTGRLDFGGASRSGDRSSRLVAARHAVSHGSAAVRAIASPRICRVCSIFT